MQIVLSLQEGELEVKFLREEDTSTSRVTAAKCKFRSKGGANLIKLIKGRVSDPYLAIFRFETKEQDLKKAKDAFFDLYPTFNIRLDGAELIISVSPGNSEQPFSETDILRRIKGIAKGRVHLRDHLKANGLSDAEIDKRVKNYLNGKKQALPSATLKQSKDRLKCQHCGRSVMAYYLETHLKNTCPINRKLNSEKSNKQVTGLPTGNNSDAKIKSSTSRYRCKYCGSEIEAHYYFLNYCPHCNRKLDQSHIDLFVKPSIVQGGLPGLGKRK